MSQITPFDRSAVRRHRDRAATLIDDHDMVLAEVGGRLLDRLTDLRRTFARALDLGARHGMLGRLLAGRGGIETLLACDCAPAMAVRAPSAFVAEEDALPVRPGSLDLVLSNLSLHWVNDLPGALIQARQALRPDGLFLASLLGGDTLHELRVSLQQAESEIEGGLSPRLSPLTDTRAAGALMQRAGFALPVVDCDRLTVSYESPFQLLADLRGLGETNAHMERRRAFSRRATLLRAVELYAKRFPDPKEPGRVVATFQVLYLTGWAPHESQPAALRPGAARNRLADALSTEEIGAGVKPGG